MSVEPITLLDLKPGDENDILDRVYTDRLRRTIADAKALAQSRGDASVDEVHFFLSIGDDGCAHATLATFDVCLQDLQNGLLAFLPAKQPPNPELEFGDPSERVIAGAKNFARSMSHTFLGDEHLLFALVEEPSPVSAVLRLRGVTSDTIRKQVFNLLGPTVSS